ncbi:hypothetical protein INT43_001779 [Umbelopsis isabellina]|uniref:Uncharacterized protein n=1 Tax=Mortierella isabellina TaxID=91625 RepID=A0A8H7PRG0_MORIS|nr:hypothetical protein INT43_001779 [Umbelopsis isabellina]
MTTATIDPVLQNYIRETPPAMPIYGVQHVPHHRGSKNVDNEWRKSDRSADHNTKEFENDHVQKAKLDGDEQWSTKQAGPSPSTLETPRAANKNPKESIPSPVSLLRQQLQEWEAHTQLSAHENNASCGNQHDHINAAAAQTPSQEKCVSNANLLSKSLETATTSSGQDGQRKYTPLRHMASQPDLAARPVTQVTPYTAHADKSIGAVPSSTATTSPYVPIPHNAVNTCITPGHLDHHAIAPQSAPSTVNTATTFITPPSSSSNGNIAIAANAQPHNLSRTQHKLLLQRQYVFAADRNYLAHPKNMLRLTKEMDRVNREYHQVRKFEDPMAESLRRITSRLAGNKINNNNNNKQSEVTTAEQLSRCSSTSSLSSTSSSSTPDTKGSEYLKKIYEIPFRTCQERLSQEYNKKHHVKSIINIK